MRVLITGSRGWKDRDRIHDDLKDLFEVHPDLVVIHGDNPQGADRIADLVCILLGIPVIREPALWHLYGKGAGPRRNQKMLDKHHPDLALAYRASGKSNGTDDMVSRTKNARIEVVLTTDA